MSYKSYTTYNESMGILFAFGALLSWGVGDFLIQRSTRRFGNWVALFFITTFATIVLFPFVYQELGPLFTGGGLALVLLLLATCVIFIASLLDLEALRVGKISVVEPIYAFEVPVTALLGTLVIREVLASSQIIFMVVLIAGLLLVFIHSFSHFKKIKLESGVLLALAATLCMGTANFLFGFAARTSSPLLVNWFTSTFIATLCLVYLTFTSRLSEIADHWHHRKKLILSVSLIDNLVWIFFPTARSTYPSRSRPGSAKVTLPSPPFWESYSIKRN